MSRVRLNQRHLVWIRAAVLTLLLPFFLNLCPFSCYPRKLLPLLRSVDFSWTSKSVISQLYEMHFSHFDRRFTNGKSIHGNCSYMRCTFPILIVGLRRELLVMPKIRDFLK